MAGAEENDELRRKLHWPTHSEAAELGQPLFAPRPQEDPLVAPEEDAPGPIDTDGQTTASVEDVSPEEVRPAARTKSEPIVTFEEGDREDADDATLSEGGGLQPDTADAGRDLDGVPTAIGQLSLAVASLATDIRLERTRTAADICARLARLEGVVSDLSDGVRAGASVAAALEHLDRRLSAIDEATTAAANDVRVFVGGRTEVLKRLAAAEDETTE